MTARVTQLKVTEKQWQQTVLDTAHAFGWRSYHTFDSRRSAAGFPDCVLLRGGRIVFAELKAEGGKLSQAQQDWLNDLQGLEMCAPLQVDVCVWRPSDWPEVQQVLR